MSWTRLEKERRVRTRKIGSERGREKEKEGSGRRKRAREERRGTKRLEESKRDV